MTLDERLSVALARAMALSRQRQDVAAQAQALDAELLKQAGAIDLLNELIEAAKKAGGDGV